MFVQFHVEFILPKSIEVPFSVLAHHVETNHVMIMLIINGDRYYGTAVAWRHNMQKIYFCQ